MPSGYWRGATALGHRLALALRRKCLPGSPKAVILLAKWQTTGHYWQSNSVSLTLNHLTFSVLVRLSSLPAHLTDWLNFFILFFSLLIETLESVFYFYQFDRNKNYQDIAWEIFNSLHTYCRAHSGFSGLDNVDSFTPKWDDRQESYLFAETFKYLYLMFDEQPARFPLDQWVFNTEGHPLRIVDISPLTASRFAAPPGLTMTTAAPSPSSEVWSWLEKTFDATTDAMKKMFAWLECSLLFIRFFTVN